MAEEDRSSVTVDGQGARLIVLHENGDDLLMALGSTMTGNDGPARRSTVLVLGDGIGFTTSEEGILSRFGAQPVSLGFVPLLTAVP